MAEKKTTSRAQKAVKDVKQKSGASASGKGGKKTVAETKQPQSKPAAGGVKIPPRYICALVALGLFVLFLVMALKPDGALLTFLKGFLFGTIGKAAFYIAIPALLYLFVILAFSGKQPVKARAISLIAFILICGCVHHLVVNNQSFVGGFAVLADLY